MSKTLDTLQVIITGSVKGFVSAVNQASALTKKFASGANAAFQGVRQGFNSLGSAAMKIIGPLAAAAVAFASVKSIMDAMQRAETLQKTATGLGVTTNALQKLHYAAEVSASSTEDMDRALQKMTVFLGDATEYGSGASETIEKLGLQVTDFAGLSADEAFLKMVDALKNVEDSGEKARLSQEVFGKGARELSTLIDAGSEGIKTMGEEAEKAGKILSDMDLGQMMTANDAIDKLKTSFTALSDRLATSLAPVIEWIVSGINEWMSDAKSLDRIFKGVAEGIVVAIGVIKMTWQGLQLLWESSKVVIGYLSIGFYEAAHGIVYAIKWIGDISKKTWDWIAASFNVTKEMIVTAWVWVKTKAIEAFSAMAEEFGKTIRSMGEAAAASGIKGIADVGRDAQEAGASLIVGAVRLRDGAKASLKEAKNDLDKSVVALESAREAFNQPTKIETGLENLVQNAKNFTDASIKGVRDLSDEIRKQEGGNAISTTLASYHRHLETSQKNVVAAAEKAAEKRSVIEKGLADKNALLAKQEEARHKEHLKRLVDRERFANEERAWLAKDAAQLNRTLIAEQMKAQEEYFATQEARQNAYFLDIEKRTYDSKQRLLLLEMSEEQRKAAALAEARTAYEEENFRDRMRWAEMWVTGMEGKMRVVGEIMSDFATLMQSKNKAMFQVGKAAAMSETVINTYLSAQLAYTRALEIPFAGLALAPVAAAAAIAAGMARLQSIASTSFGSSSAGGGSGGGALGGLSGAANAKEQAQASSQSNVNVTLYGSSFSAEQVRGLISAINEQSGDNMNLKAQVM